jgi:hypothetical protein
MSEITLGARARLASRESNRRGQVLAPSNKMDAGTSPICRLAKRCPCRTLASLPCGGGRGSSTRGHPALSRGLRPSGSLYDLPRPTGDTDYISINPDAVQDELFRTGGLGSPFCRKYKVYFQRVAVAGYPYEYKERLMWLALDLQKLMS